MCRRSVTRSLRSSASLSTNSNDALAQVSSSAKSGWPGPRCRSSATSSVTSAPADWLDTEARRFGDDVADLLSRTLPGAPAIKVDVVDEKLRIRTEGEGVPLRVNDNVELAWLRINFACQPDSSHKHLAVAVSTFWVVSRKARSPLLRFEYNRESRTTPHSHIQVHAERGAFSHLLARTGHERAHDLSALHLPTGGSRFRPGLEDVIQFLIVDCRVKSMDGWEQAVDEHRARWREIQTAAAARSMPGVAAKELRDLGYTVIPPEGGDPEPGRKARCAW